MRRKPHRHPRESGDPSRLGPRFRGDDGSLWRLLHNAATEARALRAAPWFFVVSVLEACFIARGHDTARFATAADPARAHSIRNSRRARYLPLPNQAAADVSPTLDHVLDRGGDARAHCARHRLGVRHAAAQHLQQRQNPDNVTFAPDPKGERPMRQNAAWRHWHRCVSAGAPSGAGCAGTGPRTRHRSARASPPPTSPRGVLKRLHGRKHQSRHRRQGPGEIPGRARRHQGHRPDPRSGRPLLHDDPVRPRRRGHQARAAAGRRGARLGPAVPRRRRQLLHRRQPQQARHLARHRQAGRARGAAALARRRRRADRELQARRNGEMGPRLPRGAVAAVSVPDPLPHLRLRRRRAAGRPARLRRHPAGNDRPDERQRRRQYRPDAARVPRSSTWAPGCIRRSAS